ncbi:hypothetical protein [Fibrella forsythiae]|uniref:LPS export ABC transporter periplasmic protein LptC n=1 Tax=Fibrella forsythiae TaxID=2817061 RepID=A0ABS3JIS4_9BACT|nr:hypothetical protein [Fibrella forsythiae]MBO0949905.1 hypothetical protein [Fibrella forsythiae]
MRTIITTTFVGLFFVLVLCTCTTRPDADAIYQTLKPGEAQFVVKMDGESFYADESRFKGEVTVRPESIRLNLFDQYESNTIVTLGGNELFKRPIVQPITLDNQNTGSVMIGKVRDKAQRTGDGFIMTEGTVTVDHLSDEKIVIRLAGKTGNFNTMNNRDTWKRLEGLLVYKRPKIIMRGDATKALLY